jgi:hypothetical protein
MDEVFVLRLGTRVRRLIYPISSCSVVRGVEVSGTADSGSLCVLDSSSRRNSGAKS